MPIRALTAAAAVFLPFGFLSLKLPFWLKIPGSRGTVLTIVLLVLVTAVTILVFVYVRAKERAAKKRDNTVDSDDIDSAIAAAEARLAAAKLSSESRIERLPVAILLGPTGSTKSSLAMHSGLDPELLSGEVMRGDMVTPTDPINVWYAHGTILMEAGGRLVDDAERWTRFVRHLHPSRLAAAVGRGRQAPRIAIVCIGCDEFLRAGASTQLAASARLIRARLGEISQQLGIRLPVYVYFTRADRLPFFPEFVRNFTTEESQQVLGTTLPVVDDTGGAWAERESARLNNAFGRILYSLSLRRTEVLSRETQEDARGSSYEFPREMRKMVEPAVQFLLDVFRPSQLGVNPLLRGFYFTGVRPIIIRDSGTDFVPPQGGQAAMEGGATAVFSAAAMRQAAAQGEARRAGGGRKVAQWVFVHRLFQDVILRDAVAGLLTGGGARVDYLRRGLIGIAAAACVLLALGFSVSFVRNMAMVRSASSALKGALDVGSVETRPINEDLKKLDPLRAQTQEISRWEYERKPLLRTLGLYAGDNIQPALSQAYFARFRRTLWDSTQRKLLLFLGTLPPAPDGKVAFRPAQEALAAYLMTTSDTALNTKGMLAPTLTSFWSGTASDSAGSGDELVDSTQALARRQFEFFSEMLNYKNPFDDTRDAKLVDATRGLLIKFGPEAYYQVMVYEASNGRTLRYTGPSPALNNNHPVSLAFTKQMYPAVLKKMDSVDAIFSRYEWIYGKDKPEKPKLEDLQRLYQNEYVVEWQTYLQNARVAAFSGPLDAAQKVKALATPNSPLVSMLFVASRETNLPDSANRISLAFQPLRALVPPNDPARPTQSLGGYLALLGTLGTHLELAATQQGGDMTSNVTEDAALLRGNVSAIQGSNVAPGDAAITSGIISALLAQPIERNLVAFVAPRDAVVDANISFCRAFAPLQDRYPFNVSGDNAPIDAVTKVFRRDGGAFWTYHKQSLSAFFNDKGEALPGADALNAGFANFFTRAADFANGLYAQPGAPLIRFTFRPLDMTSTTEVVLEVDGRKLTYTSRDRSNPPIVWRPDAGQPVTLTVKTGNVEIVRETRAGTWALFRLFTGTTSPGNSEVVVWTGRSGEKFSAEVILDVAEVKPLFRPGYLSTVAKCPPKVKN